MSKKDVTYKELFEYIKKCKEIDYSNTKGYDSCIGNSKIFLKGIKSDNIYYDELSNAVKSSIKRMEIEKQYKKEFNKKPEDKDLKKFFYPLRLSNDMEDQYWNELNQSIEIKSNPNLEEVSWYSQVSIPSFFLLIIVILFVYLLTALLSGKIFKTKLIFQLEKLEQYDLAELLKISTRNENINEQNNFIERKVFKKDFEEAEELSIEEKNIVKKMYKYRKLVDDAYSKYLELNNEELSDQEIEKIQEETRIILIEYYEKIGVPVGND